MKPELYNIIKSAHISEKATRISDKFRQFVFDVSISATKPEIKSAIEHLFSVKVASVNTLIRKGKKKTFGKRLGNRKDIKKAYVSLEPGYDIDFVVTK
jgi:large subunit ribosomal protein L23